MSSLLRDCDLKDICIADECWLFLKLLLHKMSTFKSESCHGGNKGKDKITVLVYSNMAGSEKVSLLVIRKSEKPKCFKHLSNVFMWYNTRMG
jgi:hypothetical protein